MCCAADTDTHVTEQIWVSAMPLHTGEAVLLGEHGKICPHSPMRFSDMQHQGDGDTTVQVRLTDQDDAGTVVSFYVPSTKKVVSALCRPSPSPLGEEDDFETARDSQR
jgi:hypothetical protein